MELAVDEFIINWHLSNINDKKQTAESIKRLVNKKCHRLVFDYAYLNRIAEKLGDIARTRKGDTYVTLVLVKRLQMLVYNSSKVRTCEGIHVEELGLIRDQLDRLVIKSALCVQGEKKLLITTDSDLIEKAKTFEKYGVKILTPSEAEEILLSS